MTTKHDEKYKQLAQEGGFALNEDSLQFFNVGRERDRQIIELRGEQLQSETFGGQRYSTSLQDAWPLWEEMRDSEPLIELIVCNGVYEVKIWNDRICITSFVGETEADAISGAWLMWKGGNDV